MRKILGILAILAILACCAAPGVNCVSYRPPITLYDDSLTVGEVSWSTYSTGTHPTLTNDGAQAKHGSYSLKSVIPSQPGTGSSFFIFDKGAGNAIGLGSYDELRFWFYGNNSGRIILVRIFEYTGGTDLYYHFVDDWAGWRYMCIDLREPDAGSVSTLVDAEYIEFSESTGVAATYRIDKLQVFDTKASYLSMGASDLRNSTLARNDQHYNFTIIANETGNKITFLGFAESKFCYQPGSNISSYQNITSDTFEFVTDDEVVNWIVQWDGSTLTLMTAPDFELPDPADLFSLNQARDFFDARLGVFSYAIVMLIPLVTYLKTKDPGVPAIVLLFLAAAGYALDPSLAPFAELTIVGGFALLAYRIFWSRGK
jgi:hypothetical protein